MAIWSPTTTAERAYLLEWLAARLPDVDAPFDPALAVPFGVLRAGEVAAVVVYHQFRGVTIEVSIAAATPRWAHPAVISWLLSWPFEQLGVRRVTAMVAASNARSRRLVAGLGFAEEGVARAAFEHDDGVLYGLTRDDWRASRWSMGETHGQVQSKAA